MPFFISVFFLLLLVLPFTSHSSLFTEKASAATSNTLNFQGRLLTNTGGLVPDGSYNIEFKIYDDATAGSNLWTENRTGGSAITVKNGYFSAYLGNVTPFGSSIPWDQDLWLTMNVNADGEMTPRFKLTAVPYAFRAGALVDSGGNAKTADDLIQKAPSTIQAVNSALAAIRLNQSGAGGLLQLQGDSVDVFTVSKTGATTIAGPVLAKNTTNSTSALDVQNVAGNSFLKVDTTNSTATFGSNIGTASTILQGGTGGVQITSGANVNIGQSDTNGTLLVVDVKTSVGDPTGTNGAIYYNQDAQKFRCFENGAWIDCIGGAPYLGTSATFVGGVQNVLANQTAFPIENVSITSTTTFSTTTASGGFTAPSDGSFRSCLVQNTANITAGTLTLRWRVNGVSVGSAACAMDNTAPNNREISQVLNPGVVTFNAGDIIDVAFDTSAAFAPTNSNDFTVYWGVEYVAGSGGSGSGGITLQDVYDQSLSASLLTTNNRDITFNLADTAIDSDFVVNVASGSTSRLVVQNNGTDTFSVNATGDVTASGGLTVGNSSSTTAGTIRWTGTDFEGYDGANWISLTAGGGGGGSGINLVSKVKQVNESVLSNNVLQDDNELTFPIGPNEEWSYRFVVQANSQTVPDIQFAVGAPVGATCQVIFNDAENANTTAQAGCGVSSGTIPGNAAPDYYEITGTVVNGPTAGNVTLRWAQFTSNATNTIVYAGSYVQAIRSIGAGGTGQPFAQSGNAFGTTAILGTTDTQGLSIITDNVERIGVSATGNVSIAGLTTLSGNLLANRTTTGITGTTTGTGTNTTALTLTSDVFNVNDVILIDNAGQDYYTRVTVDGGGGNYTVSPAVTFETGRTVTSYTVQNIGATSTDYTNQANRFFQGYFLGGVVIGAGSTTIGDGTISSTTDLVIQGNGGNVTFGGGLTIAGTITGDASGLTNISSASIDGATISDLDAANILTGTLADARLSSNVALLAGTQTFTGAKTFSAGLTVSGGDITQTGDISATGEISGATIVGVGSGLTNLDADNLASGTVADARLSTNVVLLSGSQTFSGAKTFSNGLTISGGDISAGSANITTTGQISGATIIGDGAGLTNLEAGDIATGTLADARLSANVALLTGTQTFSGAKTFSSGLTLSGGDISAGSANITTTGQISGATIVGDGSGLTNLGAGDIASGTLSDSRLSTNVALLTGSQTFSGLKTFGNGLAISSGDISAGSANITTTGQISGATIVGDGSGLTNIDAGDIATGTLAESRLSANVTLLTGSQTFSGTKTFGNGLTISAGNLAAGSANVTTTGQITGATIIGDGSGLTNIDASDIASGTLADARLSSNVALLTGTQTFTGSKTFSSGLVLGLSTISSSATVSRAVSLPDEAGTICLSNTNTCGFLRLASGSAQTDASNNDVLSVNKTSATGNLINLQRSGGAVFTVANSGALQIQATGTAALDIRNAGGSSYFSVDTSTGAVRIGPTTADGVGVLFVLDTKNDAGDPAIGTNNNAQYYNSADGKFRCYENGAWRDCIEPINNVPLMDMFNTTAAATNLALNTLNCVSDPSLRMMMNLSGQSRLRFMGRIGGSITNANTIRLQYHLGGNPAVATGDAGWTTLATSAGNHTLNTLFYTAESSIPAAARTNNVLVRACLFSGNTAADPTITGVTINTYD